jgi:antitoxin component HigA of HigAB toxin-antitoxin module
VKNLDRQNKKLTQSLLKRGIDPNNFVRVQDLLPIVNELEDEINAIPTPTPDPVLRYKALLTQSGTDAPVATVLENSLGGTPSITYVDVGTYNLTLDKAFRTNKTFVLTGLGLSFSSFTGTLFRYQIIGEDTIRLFTYLLDAGDITSVSLANGKLSNFSIQIEVYP